jgi:hypothetical protein
MYDGWENWDMSIDLSGGNAPGYRYYFVSWTVNFSLMNRNKPTKCTINAHHDENTQGFWTP